MSPPQIPPEFQAPGPSWTERINWRVAIFAAVVLIIIGLPLYVWLNEIITGGIHDYGAYKEVDLKAMSTFDMDQVNATMDDIPRKWRALDGQKVLAIGEMWDPHSAGSDELGYFQLVYSKTKCCFSGPPLAQHFVDGYVVKGRHVYYYDYCPVKVFGTIHTYIRKDPGGVIKSIYHIDVDQVSPIEQ